MILYKDMNDGDTDFFDMVDDTFVPFPISYNQHK